MDSKINNWGKKFEELRKEPRVKWLIDKQPETTAEEITRRK